MTNQETVAPLLRRLEQLRRRIRNLYLVDGASLVALTLCAFFAATFLLDWALHLPQAVRLVFLTAGVAAVITTALRRLLRPATLPITDDALAVLVERHNPPLADRLISAIQLTRDPGGSFNSPELVGHLVQDAVGAASALDFQKVLTDRFVMRVAALAGAFSVTLGSLALAAPDLAAIYLRRLVGLEASWPKRTELVVEGFQNHTRTIPRGDSLTIVVRVVKGSPDRALLFAVHEETGPAAPESMRLVGNAREGYRFVTEFPRVPGPFRFHVVAGDDRTPEHQVLTDTPPTIMNWQAFFTYPPYTGLPSTSPLAPEPGGSFEVPLLTRVTLRGLSNEPLTGAAAGLLPGDTRPSVELDPADPRVFSFSFDIAEERTKYEVTLTAANGLRNRDKLVYDVRGIPDQKPDIKRASPPANQHEEVVTPVCDYPIRAAITDDYGFKRDAGGRPELRLSFRLSADPADSWRTVALKFPDAAVKEVTQPRGARVDLEYSFALEPLGLKPGDWIVMNLSATDNKDVGGANEARTRDFRFSVASVEELEKELEAAVDRIKQELTKQREAATRNRARTRQHQQDYTTEALEALPKSEVLMSHRNQLGIARALRGETDKIRHVRDRGRYNKIFNEEAVRRLDEAAHELERLAGEEAGADAACRLAAEALNQAADARTRASREEALELTVRLIDETIGGITQALNLLERWATYQEVVRALRVVYKEQQKIKEWLLERLPGGADPKDK